MSAGGGAVLLPPLWRAVPVCAPWCPSLRSLPLCHGPWCFPFLARWWFPAPVLRRPRCPVPVGACLLPWAPPRPLAGLSFPVPCPSFALALSLPGVVVVGWGGGLRGADGPCLGVGGLEPPAEVFGGVGAAEALDSVPEEGFPCRLRHDGLRGGLVGVGGGAGADLLEGVHHVQPFSPSRSPGPLHPPAELPQGRGRKPGEVDGGLGAGGLRARGPGAAVAGAGGGGCVRAAGRTGLTVLLVGGGGRGHGTAVACVAAPEGAGAAGARPWGVVVAPRGAGAARGSGLAAVALWGA